ncbi:site-specific integrase [Rhizobium rhizogenes]|uniref:site-specific integrase n=1 Tax=Rhizobium rhizogenes TaxID=359 RepID=UPI0012961A2C|nr:site-specific integrase [Rhizobium rhizogenes]MQB34746.1 hypothetical protein [Rhizobium rhizogenes]
MAQPSKDSRTGVYEYRKRVPEDLRSFVGKKEIIKSLGTKDIGEAKVRFTKVAAEIEERFANLRAGLRSLTEHEAATMAGEIYRAKVAANFQNPSKLSDSFFARAGDAFEFQDHPDRAITKAFITPGKEGLAEQMLLRRNDHEISAYLQERGIRLYDESMDLLRVKVAKAAHRARKYLRDLSNDDANPTVDPYANLYPTGQGSAPASIPAPALTATSAAPLLSVAIAAWAKDKKTAWADSSADMNRLWAERFMEMASDKALDQYTKKDAREFKGALKRLPRNYTRHPKLKGLAFVDAAEKAEAFALAPMSDRNVNKILGFVRALWNWAEAHHDDVPRNPFNGLNIRLGESGRDDRLPFTETELQIIFKAPLYTGCKSSAAWLTKGAHIPVDEGIYWVPLLGLYTGARAGEIIQLNVVDVGELGEIHYLKITDDGEEQGTKTDSSVREIPIHPVLLELGFLKFVDTQRRAGRERLFPEMPKVGKYYSTAYAPRFKRLLESLKIKHAKNSFHSFRHNFEDVALDSLIPQGIVDALLGHSSSGMSKRYGTGLRKLRVLNKEIQKFRPDSLDLTHLQARRLS